MASQPPTLLIRVSAPGKVILHGEHSVVYGKLAVAASLGLRTRLEFSEVENEQNGVSIEFPSLNLLHFYSFQEVQNLLNKPLPVTKSPSNYNFTHPELLDYEDVLATIKTFISDNSGSRPLEPKQEVALISFLYLFWSFLGPLNSELRPFHLKISSELAISAGTGSSASFAVTIAAFLLQYIRLKKPKTKNSYKNYKIANTNLASFDKNELELISKWAFQSEKIMHGTPSGVDNTVCTFGGLVEFRKGSTPKLIEMSTKFSLILVNTNVSRDTKQLVANVAAKRDKYRGIIDGILETMDQVTGKALDYMRNINGRMGDEVEVGDLYENLGELTDVNQNLLRCLGVSHPKLDEICLVLARSGLHGKLTGAGGGGYAVCLVPPKFVKNVGKVLEELNSKGFEAVLTDLGGCGVSIDSV